MRELEDFKRAIRSANQKMIDRFSQKREGGYSGWDGAYSKHRLMVELNKDSVSILKGAEVEKNLVDIMNRAAFLLYRQSANADLCSCSDPAKVYKTQPTFFCGECGLDISEQD